MFEGTIPGIQKENTRKPLLWGVRFQHFHSSRWFKGTKGKRLFLWFRNERKSRGSAHQNSEARVRKPSRARVSCSPWLQRKKGRPQFVWPQLHTHASLGIPSDFQGVVRPFPRAQKGSVCDVLSRGLKMGPLHTSDHGLLQRPDMALGRNASSGHWHRRGQALGRLQETPG